MVDRRSVFGGWMDEWMGVKSVLRDCLVQSKNLNVIGFAKLGCYLKSNLNLKYITDSGLAILGLFRNYVTQIGRRCD
jgi:hypothetical protein